MTVRFQNILRDLTLLLCAGIGVLLFSQIPGVVTTYADTADQTARTALEELQKRYPAAQKDLRGFVTKTLAEKKDDTAAVRQLLTKAQELSAQAVHLKSAPWWEQPVMLAQKHDPRLLRGTLVSYRPTLTLHPIWAAIGAAWGWISFAALSWIGRKVFRAKK